MTSLTKSTTNFFVKARLDNMLNLEFEQLLRAICRGAVGMVRQPTTAGFQPISRYEYIAHRLSRC